MRLQLKWTLALFFIVLQFSFAQEKTVNGTVKDESGIPLPGVTVLVKGTSQGTQTDFDGKYSISVKKGSVLTFSYVGMKSEDKTVGNSSTIDVVLKVDAQELDDVVVVAYGSADKKSLTGSVATIKGDDLTKNQTTDVAKALEGSVAGVSISNSSGQPGSSSSIRIRGIGSIYASSNPLIIVDGSPYEGELNSINNNDVESISVLKDAASAALYGARGANGVIIITTKKGKKGALKVSLDSRVGINSRAVPEYDIITSPAEFYETKWEAIYNKSIFAEKKSDADARKFASSVNGLYAELGYNIYNIANDKIIDPLTGKINPNAVIKYEDAENFNDWKGILLSPQLRQEHNLSISKGTDKNSYYFSVGYLGDNGYSQNSNFDRLSSRLSYDGELLSWVKINTNTMFTYTESNANHSGTSYSNPFSFTRNIGPIYPIYDHDKDGKLIYDKNGNKVYDFGEKNSIHEKRSYGASQNPVATQREDIRLFVNYYINQVAKLDIELAEGLTFSSSNNAYVNVYESNEFNTPIGGSGKTYNGIANKYRANILTLNFIQTLKYTKELNDFNLEFLLGHETFKRSSSTIFGKKVNFVDPKNSEWSNAATTSELTSYTRNYALEGFFGQFTTNYSEKYYLSASIRRDASSVFAPENRWGTFWSTGLSWRVEKENFMQGVDFVDLLKLRASYGVQGNDHLFLPGSGSRSYTPYITLYNITTDGKAPGLEAAYKGRREVTWEENANFDVGLEVALFENRVNVEVDYFHRKTNNLLFNLPVPSSTGFSTEPWNIGNMINKGIEFSVGVTPIKTNDITWNLNFNGISYKNTILSLPERFRKDGITRGSQRITEGGSIFDFYMVKWGGVNPDDGDAQFWIKDNTTGEFKLKPSAEYDAGSRQNVGSAIPDLAGGFGTNLTVYGFDLNAQFSYQLGGLILDSEYGGLMSPSGGGSDFGKNWHTDIRNRWTPNNRNTDVPRIEQNSQALGHGSSRFLTDASYIAIRNINIGYNFPEKFLEPTGIKSLRYYISADNVFVWSKRIGLDPRVSISGFNDTPTYSPIRTISMGLLLTL